MAPFLKVSLLGFGRFCKLMHPRTTPLYIVHLPGWGPLHLMAFSFQKGNG